MFPCKKGRQAQKFLECEKASVVLQYAQNAKFDLSASDGVVAHHRSQPLSFLLFICNSLMNSYRKYVLLSTNLPKFS